MSPTPANKGDGQLLRGLFVVVVGFFLQLFLLLFLLGQLSHSGDSLQLVFVARRSISRKKGIEIVKFMN